MKKLRRVGILVAVVMLVVVVVYLFEKNTDELEKIFVIPVNSDEYLLVRRRDIILLKYISRKIS